MVWISPKDKLPEIPKGQYGISVLVTIFDPIFEECCPGKGARVYTGIHYGSVKGMNGEYISPLFEGWDKEYDFYEMVLGSGFKYGYEWQPVTDEIIGWMYLPEPMKRENYE